MQVCAREIAKLRRPWRPGWALVPALLLLSVACAGADREPRPNVLWVVWDTVRADRMSLYGHSRPTTPKLDEWARGARVFEQCISTANSTVPSHASMFTGLLPSEHGTHNHHRFLDDHYETVAELLQQAGYQTYLFAANPHIAQEQNFTQGFDVEEHPWDPAYKDEAIRILRSKLAPQDRSSELPRKFAAGELREWDIKACGELAHRGLVSWLDQIDEEKPFFAFLNYMEAHRPFIPPTANRERIMTPEEIELSYRIDRSWMPMWAYTFGFNEYSEQELDVMASTYDACLTELDDLLHALLQDLEAGGHLENTVVILTSDHGELLGEHHMMDHQYSLHDAVIRVPLLIHYPERFEPGRDSRPVVTYDLFPTILELAGVDAPEEQKSQAVSLLRDPGERARLAEYPSPFAQPILPLLSRYPDWDPAPWIRVLRAYHEEDMKYVWASDGRHALYNLREDPGEERNLIEDGTTSTEPIDRRLHDFVATLKPLISGDEAPGELSEDQRRRLESLGYLAGKRAKKRQVPASPRLPDPWPTLPLE